MTNHNDKSTLLPITIEGHTFTPDTDGMWSLNEIHKVLGLPDSKAPSEWRNAVQAELVNSGNFRIKAGRNGGTWATELGAIAYAMWVSTDFYLMVAGAFVTMRNDAVIQARVALLAAATSDAKLAKAAPKADVIDHRLRPGGTGVTWGDACRMAGVSKPMLAKRYLRAIGRFRTVKNYDTDTERLVPVAKAFELGYFKRRNSQSGNTDGFAVTGTGLAWLQGRAQEINEAIRERDKAKAKKKPVRVHKDADGYVTDITGDGAEKLKTHQL
ncbi:KilA-N domain-containing protein [Pseudomonas sp. B11]